MGRVSRVGLGLCVLLVLGMAAAVRAQPPNPNARTNFVKIDAPVVVLTHARVIDGTGAPPRANQTLIIRDGNIAAVGDVSSIQLPAGATIIDLTGRTVLPGLVMVHEHLYYTTGPGVYGQLGASFSRLYLAGGVTTMRTGGNVNGIMDINLARRIAEGEFAGPAIDATAPYLNGPNSFLQMHAVRTADEARRHVAYWADQGATSVKAYMQISREALKAGIDEAHRRGMKVTGHLCSVTYGEAADAGIDNLEHGFLPPPISSPTSSPMSVRGRARGSRRSPRSTKTAARFGRSSGNSWIVGWRSRPR